MPFEFLRFIFHRVHLHTVFVISLPFANSSLMAGSRWIKPEVYPLFAAVGAVVGICAMQLVRNISTNPEVRVNKENRLAGVLDNHAEGEAYAEHRFRKFVRNKPRQVMPSVNDFFSDPQLK